VQVEVDFHVEEDYLIAELDLFTFLSVLVTGKDLEVDSLIRFVNQFHLVAGLFDVCACFLSAKVGFAVHMEQLDLTTVSDELTPPSLNELLVGILFVEHFLLKLGDILLIRSLFGSLFHKLFLMILGISGLSGLCWRTNGGGRWGSISLLVRLRSLLFHRDVALVEFDGLFVIFAGIKVHLWLDLKDEVARIPAEGLRSEVILLNVY